MKKAHPAARSRPAKALVPPVKKLAPTLGAVDGSSSSTPRAVGFALSGTLAISLALLGLALTPLRLVPKGVRLHLYDRRQPLLYTAAVVYFTTGLSLAIALVFS